MSLMVICSLDTLKKSSKKQEMRIKQETVEVLQQPSYRRQQPFRGVLRIFTKFIGKRVCQSFFFNKVAGLRPSALLKKTPA